MQEIYKGAASNDKTGTPARTAAQIINDNFEYLDNKITRKDGIVVSTGYAGTPEDKIMNIYWEWIIDTIDYTNPAPVPLNFPYAASGKMRLDMIALTTSNTAIRIAGPESDSNPVSAPLPNNMIQAGLVLVTDSEVGESSSPVIGDLYVKKLESQDVIINYGATTVIEQINLTDDRNSISLTGAVTDVKSIQVSGEFIRMGKPHFFKNRTSHDVKLWHLEGTGNIKYFFPNGLDLIVKPNEVIQFNTNANDSSVVRFEYVGGSMSVVDRFKGVFPSEAALNSAYPTASAGDSAQVNEPGSVKVVNYSWDAEDNVWVEGGSGGSGATNTDMLPEGSSNLYFTTARVLATVLSGLSLLTGGAIVSTDTVLQAFGKIQNSINDLYSKIPSNYTNIVYVNATSPTSATIFDLANPPVTNDNALKNDVNNLYVGTDASMWVYNSGTSSYVTQVVAYMTTNTPQNVTGVKTFFNGMFGLRNVANTFTSFFSNSNTASRTYTLQNRNGTLLDDTDLSTINSSLATKQSVFTGVANYLTKSLNSTTLIVSRLFDNGIFFGIGATKTPTKDITLGNQSNKVIGIEESSNVIVGRDLRVEAGRTINYVESVNFLPLSQPVREWYGVSCHTNGNVYAVVNGGDIYKQTAGTGNFVALSQTVRVWIDIACHPNGNVYATVSNGDIYMQTAGTGNFVALSQTSRAWYGIACHSNGNVYATVQSGDIYKQTAGTGNFVALGQANRYWWGIKCHPNGNVYAVENGGDIYKQTAGTGNFVALSQTSRAWIGIACNSNSNVYATTLGGDIYMQTAGTGNFVALGQTSRAWIGIDCYSNGNVYACEKAGDMYMQQNNGVGSPDLDGGTLILAGGGGKGNAKSRIEIKTGQKTVSGTDMHVEKLRAVYDESGNYKRIGTPVYADNTAALAGGLTAGMEYRTSTGIKMEVY